MGSLYSVISSFQLALSDPRLPLSTKIAQSNEVIFGVKEVKNRRVVWMVFLINAHLIVIAFNEDD